MRGNCRVNLKHANEKSTTKRGSSACSRPPSWNFHCWAPCRRGWARLDSHRHFPSLHSRSTMSDLDRRKFLKGLLGSLVQATATVVVASAVASTARAREGQAEEAETPPEDV